jgi:hypothetical protein
MEFSHLVSMIIYVTYVVFDVRCFVMNECFVPFQKIQKIQIISFWAKVVFGPKRFF